MSSTAPVLFAPAARSTPTSARLDYLDGLRGLSALYVVLFHAGPGFCKYPVPLWAKIVLRALSYGHFPVAVFIVLSGFSLMLPVARGNGRLAGGAAGYLRRRARRILPPYYGALALSLALIGAVPALGSPTGTVWDGSAPFTRGSLISHILLVHNLSTSWVHQINGPMWSVATEWQIYFFLPYLLLPIWRSAGMLATLVAGFVLGLLPCLLAPDVSEMAAPWYLGLFAIGMVAAGISFSSRAAETALRARVPWGMVSLSIWATCAVGGTVLVKTWFRHMTIADVLVGSATGCLLTYLARSHPPSGARRSKLLSLLEAKPVVTLGHFSYSLYLTHMPILALFYLAVTAHGLAPVAGMIAMLTLATLASIAFAYVFHLLLERRFMNRPIAARGQQRTEQASPAART